MFFKRFVFVLLAWPALSYSNLASNWDLPIGKTCIKDMSARYSAFLEGRLTENQRVLFFDCLHDFLHLVVFHDRLIYHDASRDHFTREELARTFYHIIGVKDGPLAYHYTDTLLLVKKIFVGGAIDKLRDEELRLFRDITYDLEDVYRILQPWFPTFKRVFTGGPGALGEDEKTQLERALNSALHVLMAAYQRENLVYRIDDLKHYADYMIHLGWAQPQQAEALQGGFGFLHHLSAGLFPSKTAVQGRDWPAFMSAFYESIKIFLYYKTHFHNIDPHTQADRILDIAGMLIDLLPTGYGTTEGFPLKNIDGLLTSLLSFAGGGGASSESSFLGSVLQSLRRPYMVPLLTRTLFCFAINPSKGERPCQSEWGDGESGYMLKLVFQDAVFELFSRSIIKKDRRPPAPVMVSQEQLRDLRDYWLLSIETAL